MKRFASNVFSAQTCADQLAEFKVLLDGHASLSERRQLKPFFERARQWCAFIGAYVPDLGAADLLAYEFAVAGDFVADIVLGREESQSFCMVELEDASKPGIFVRGKPNASEWNKRFEHGFSQLLDWFHALDDLRGTEQFARNFGHGHARFHGLLVIGRSNDVSEQDRRRLRWRAEKVLVDSHPVHCITYDELHQHLDRRLRAYSTGTGSGETQTPR